MFPGGFGDDQVAVEGDAVDVVAVHHRRGEVRVYDRDGLVGAGGGVGKLGEDPLEAEHVNIYIEFLFFN